MHSRQKKVIAKLQTLNFHSVEFYHVATNYFCRRLRVIRNCGLFFIIFAALSLVIVLTTRESWLFDIKFCAFSLFCAIIGWTPFRIGKYGIQMIKTARKADVQDRMNALHFMAATAKPFRGDPVGAFILQRFGDNNHAV
jgi:hypothetical protein